jgi:two-component system phosphate regulon response regulator OmpR
MNADAPHILVVDDDTRLRDLLRQYLAENGFVVTTASDAAEARAKLAGLTFDLIVLDVMMPGENGLDFTESLRRGSRVPILLLTARGEPEDRIEGFERGADDYLGKPFEPRELVLRIRTILRRAAPPATAVVIRLGGCAFDVARETLSRDQRPVRLTPVESSLLKTLALNPGVTLSRDELIHRSRIEGNERTVDVQVTRLRRKIEPDPRLPRYLQTVRGEGYVLRPD